MARIVVLGTGIGAMSAACQSRADLDSKYTVTLVGQDEKFSFTPSNPRKTR